MNVRGRNLSAISGLIVFLSMAVYGLGSVDRTTTGPTKFAGWTGTTSSTDQSDSAAMTPDDDVAVRLLAKSVRASTELSFYATVVSSTSLGAQTVSITHIAGHGTRVVDGASTQWLADGSADEFAQAGKSLTMLATNYRVIRDASRDKVIAHRPAAAINALDTQGRTVARFWIDQATGLLVGKETLASNGLVRASYEFTSFELARKSSAPGPDQVDTWGSAINAAQLRELRQSGCGCPDALPKNLILLETRVSKVPTPGSDAPAIHQVFSDGIAAVSLFFVPGSLTEAQAQELTSAGFRAADHTASAAWIRPARWNNDVWTAIWEDHGRIVTAIVSGSADDQRTLEMIVSAESPQVNLDESTVMGRVMLGWQRLVGLLG